MVSRRSPHGWPIWCAWFLALCCGFAPGCQWLGDRHAPLATEESQVEKPSNMMGHMRASGPKGKQLGLDPQAKEIERNLGVN